MFGYLAESLTYLLIKHKKLDIEDRDIYIYGLEAILLNGSLIVSFLIISLLFDMLFHFIGCIIFFIPLRIFVGGYHAKKSEICFMMSIITYIVTLIAVKYNSELYQDIKILIVTIVALIIMGVGAPLKDPNHPLADYQYKRNKRVLFGIVIIDFALFIVFVMCEFQIASSVIMFVLTVFIMFLTAVVQQLHGNRLR